MSNFKAIQQIDTDLMFEDYYDEKLLKLGGGRFINERKKKLPLSSQLNMLSSCGFKVPNHGYVEEHKQRLCSKNATSRVVRDSQIVIKTSSGEIVRESCRKAANNPLLKNQYGSDFIPSAEEGKITRYLIMVGNLFSYTMKVKNGFQDAYWAVGSKMVHQNMIVYSELVTEDLSDRRVKEFINKYGAFYPAVTIDIIEAEDGEEYAVSLDIGPRFEGTPIQNIAPAEVMAKLLVDNMPHYM